VRSSTSASKRAFLQQKGLTEGEIDEAFKRAPEPPPEPPAAPPCSTPSAALAATAQHLHPAPYAQHPHQAMRAMHRADQPVRWSQVALGAGFAAAGAYAVKSLVWPYVHDAYSGWRARRGPATPPPPPPPPPAAAAADKAAAEVAAAIREQTAELAASIQTMKELVHKLEAARPPPGGAANAPDLDPALGAAAATVHE
jgi:hypothetical protein